MNPFCVNLGEQIYICILPMDKERCSVYLQNYSYKYKFWVLKFKKKDF